MKVHTDGVRAALASKAPVVRISKAPVVRISKAPVVRISKGTRGCSAEVVLPTGEHLEIIVRGAADARTHLRAIEAALTAYQGGAAVPARALTLVGRSLQIARGTATLAEDGDGVTAIETAARVLSQRVPVCPRCELAADHDLPGIPVCRCGGLVS